MMLQSNYNMKWPGVEIIEEVHDKVSLECSKLSNLKNSHSHTAKGMHSNEMKSYLDKKFLSQLFSLVV